jgi:hypothetical protein
MEDVGAILFDVFGTVVDWCDTVSRYVQRQAEVLGVREGSPILSCPLSTDYCSRRLQGLGGVCRGMEKGLWDYDASGSPTHPLIAQLHPILHRAQIAAGMEGSLNVDVLHRQVRSFAVSI